MTSFKDLCWNVDEETYRNDPAFSYSTLSRFLREGFECIDKLYDKVSSPALTFGSMVDTLITDGKEAFDKRFFVATMPELSDTLKKIVESLYDKFGTIAVNIHQVSDKDIITECGLFEYGKTWKNETRISKVKTEGSIYYNFLKLSNGKEVVSTEMYDAAVNCVEALKNAEATRWYFADNNPWDGIERFYQLKIKGKWEDIDLRCMIDLLVVDHKNKIIQPVDLKTSGHPEYKFYQSYVKWNYNIQQSLYTYLIKQLIATNPEYSEYKVMPYKFIVVNKDTCRPEVWEVTQMMADAIDDFTIGETTFRNWRHIARELKESLEPGRTVPVGIFESQINSISEWLQK